MTFLKSALLLAVAVVGISAMATPGTITPIEQPSLVCQGDIGVITISEELERVWHGEPGQSDGMELQVLQFDRFRCPHTYEIQAKLIFFGTKADAHLKTTGCGVETVGLEYSIQGQKHDMPCEVR